MPPPWPRAPTNHMSWQFGSTPLYTSPSPQTPSPQTPSHQPTQFSSASPTTPAMGTSVPANRIPATTTNC